MRIISATVAATGAVHIAADDEVTSWVVTRSESKAVVDRGAALAAAAKPTAGGNFHHTVTAQPPGTYLITVSGPSGTTSVTVTIP